MWNRFITKLQRRRGPGPGPGRGPGPGPGPRPRRRPGPGPRPDQGVADVEVSSQGPRRGPLHKFETIQDAMKPEIDCG